MSIKINYNIFSTLVQRNLTNIGRDLEQSFERLSTGERINRSADDPSGLALSERLRYEIQGLQQNEQNVNGAFSMLGTAESYLDNMVDMLQRMRELAVQAGSETLGPTHRAAIQDEIDQLTSEVERIASSGKYNEYNLFDGTLQNLAVQVGTDSLQTVLVSLDDYRTGALGARAEKISDQSVSSTAITAGTLLINGEEAPDSISDGVSVVNANASALAKAQAINRIESQTGVHADAQATTFNATGSLQAVTLDGITNVLYVNGVNIQPVDVAAGDANGTLVQAINGKTAQTGVTASVDGSGKLQLIAADGRNIKIVTEGSIGDELGFQGTDGDVDLTLTAKVTLSASKPFVLNDAGGVLGMTVALQQVNADPSTAIGNMTVADADAASRMLRSLDTAIDQINKGRSSLGALNNRLEGVVDSLAQRIENLSASDSRIRDTDFAFETARLTQSQILQDAAIAMLTQANIAPQRALELIREL